MTKVDVEKLTIEEARALYGKLKEVFGKDEPKEKEYIYVPSYVPYYTEPNPQPTIDWIYNIYSSSSPYPVKRGGPELG